MSLTEKFIDDLKQSMRSGDTARRDVIRYIRSAIRNMEIECQKEADDEAVIELLGRQAKQRRDSIEAFTEGNRQDLVDKEKAELEIILEYMPAQLSDDELTELVKKAIDDAGATSPADMGKVMGRVMPQVKGKAEGQRVSAIASELLKSAGG